MVRSSNAILVRIRASSSTLCSTPDVVSRVSRNWSSSVCAAKPRTRSTYAPATVRIIDSIVRSESALPKPSRARLAASRFRSQV